MPLLKSGAFKFFQLYPGDVMGKYRTYCFLDQ